MRIVQRTFLLLIVIFMLVIGIAHVYKEREKKEARQWESLLTELYLEKLCRSQRVTQEGYLRYVQSLNYGSTVSHIRIEQYQKEQDLKGKVYYYLISWEELQNRLFEEESALLLKDSVICITVERRSRKQSKVTKYYGIVTGRE